MLPRCMVLMFENIELEKLFCPSATGKMVARESGEEPSSIIESLSEPDAVVPPLLLTEQEWKSRKQNNDKKIMRMCIRTFRQLHSLFFFLYKQLQLRLLDDLHNF